MDASYITLIILGVMALLFVTELVPLAITSMGGAIACGIAGVVPMKAVFSGLSNNTVVLFAGMFVIGAALFYTGLAQKIGETVVRAAGTGENKLMFAIMVIAAILSAVLSNTGTTAALMPVVLGICAVAKIPASRQLMPLAFAASMGGTITLVGTPPNVIAAGAMKAAGLEPFGFFEFAYIGVPLTIAGIIYMITIGKRLLPSHEIKADLEIEQEVDVVSNDPKKQIISGIILLGIVIVMAKHYLPLSVAAIIGAMLCVLTGCLKEKQAYHSIDWVTIFLFAGMMPVATAMDKSGAGKLIADTVIGFMGEDPSPILATAILFILSSTLTQFMSNTASSALLAPIGIAIAHKLGADPKAVLMAIAISASCAFATPVGTPPNTLVYGPGQYHFNDYIKAGLPLIIVCFIVSIIVIPIIWPF